MKNLWAVIQYKIKNFFKKGDPDEHQEHWGIGS